MATFQDDVLRVAHLKLPAPLVVYGQLKLFAAVQQLAHDDLVSAAEDLKLKSHPAIPTDELMFRVASELQQLWFGRMGVIPANVVKNHEARRARFEALVKKLEEGKVMAPKAKSAKASNRPKAAKAAVKLFTYAALRSKIAESKLAKKVEDPKVTSHVPLVAQVLMSKPDKAWPLTELVEAIEKTGRYDGKGKLEGNVRNDLRFLEKEALIRVSAVE